MSNAQRYRNKVELAKELERVTAERDQLRHQNAELLGQLDAIEFAHNVRLAERDRLWKAIETHRRNIWGEGSIEHYEDRQLYAALQDDER